MNNDIVTDLLTFECYSLSENVFDDLFIHSHNWLDNAVLCHANPVSKKYNKECILIFFFADAFLLTQNCQDILYVI